ncbi:MAG TPA: helix-turn-helix transcriptional regulator [Phnomibacter sp.]|nr:helix-turn-helix transcriptional regulator [Phnomibacter sp.]
MSIEINIYRPCEALRPYVHSFWYGRFNEDRSPLFVQQVMPTGFVELIFHLSSQHCFLLQHGAWSKSPLYTLVGLFSKPYEVHFKDKVDCFGIRLKPEGIYNLFGVPGSKFSGEYLDMEMVLDSTFRSFSEQLIGALQPEKMVQLTEAYLLSCYRSNNINYYYLNHAAESIRNSYGMLSVDELCKQVYISQRQLEREFSEKLGLSPKQYQRLVRISRVNELLVQQGKPQLTDIGYEAGYADQAHFIREFRQFARVTPSGFLRSKREFLVNL